MVAIARVGQKMLLVLVACQFLLVTCNPMRSSVRRPFLSNKREKRDTDVDQCQAMTYNVDSTSSDYVDECGTIYNEVLINNVTFMNATCPTTVTTDLGTPCRPYRSQDFSSAINLVLYCYPEHVTGNNDNNNESP
ncbi:hypothetical protein Pmani_009997 [Petrolisthes manimaculis]|uniref:Uncharacterized protein n=1 Tax=Petrolisthes manimaculis TaxID=1843537 RepID=A0AAE1Q326_9EUCA|nr:hypothetical protein Pmani_009997 [Petrolisthes manimaculis]